MTLRGIGALALTMLLLASTALASVADEPHLTKERAVALVLEEDERYHGLADWDILRRRSMATFEPFTLENSYYRDLSAVLYGSPLTLTGFYAVAPEPAVSRLIEVTLVRDCTRWSPPDDLVIADDTVPSIDDPCAWRHTWYYRVRPDGQVELLFEEGDPDT